LEDALGRAADRHSPWVFARMRRLHPIVSTRRFAVVTRAADVREVLGDHACFHVLYEPKMTAITGPFILGLDGTALYRHDDAALRAAVRPEDLPGVGEEMLAAARERIARAAGGQIDVVAELADPAIDRVISRYFGTPGPDTATQLRWARSLFQEIFINVADNPAVRDRALADAAQMRRHLDVLIAARKAQARSGGSAPDDVLTRLLRVRPRDGGLHDVSIRHNLIGLVVGWIPTASKAFANVIEELLRRPAELERAQHAARDGDRDAVAAHVFEALRFRPQNWALLRMCVRDRTIAADTARATTIRQGATVFAATQSAMFDESAVAAPEEFRVNRRWSDYMHFGHGLHTCFGQEINRVQLPALATALLEGPPIERATGDAGRMRWRGPYPVGLGVSLSDGRGR
jgi:cytochrome P450